MNERIWDKFPVSPNGSASSWMSVLQPQADCGGASSWLQQSRARCEQVRMTAGNLLRQNQDGLDRESGEQARQKRTANRSWSTMRGSG